MSLPTTASILQTPTCVGATVEYPFRNNGDSSTKIYNHIMQVKLTDYAPLSDNDTMTAATKKPVRSPFPDDANAFYIGDSQPEPMDGGMVQFVRSFSNIPASRVEGAGLYAFTFPSNNNAASTFIMSASKSGRSFAPNRCEFSFYATNAQAANFGIGDIFMVGYNLYEYEPLRIYWQGDTSYRDIQPKMVVYYKEVESSGYRIKGYLSSFSSIDFSQSLPSSSGAYGYHWTTGSGNYGIAVQKTIGRVDEITENAESFLTYRYVKTDNINNETFASKFDILQYVVADDIEHGFVSTDTLAAGTSPSIYEYNGLVSSGGLMQAEPEVAVRWRGNIWEIAGRQIVAK